MPPTQCASHIFTWLFASRMMYICCRGLRPRLASRGPIPFAGAIHEMKWYSILLDAASRKRAYRLSPKAMVLCSSAAEAQLKLPIMGCSCWDIDMHVLLGAEVAGGKQ